GSDLPRLSHRDVDAGALARAAPPPVRCRARWAGATASLGRLSSGNRAARSAIVGAGRIISGIGIRWISQAGPEEQGWLEQQGDQTRLCPSPRGILNSVRVKIVTEALPFRRPAGGTRCARARRCAYWRERSDTS